MYQGHDHLKFIDKLKGLCLSHGIQQSAQYKVSVRYKHFYIGWLTTIIRIAQAKYRLFLNYQQEH